MHSIAHMLDPSVWGALLTRGWSDLGETEFWLALVKLIWINILLSGDNAVVIAMACRGLPARQRRWGTVLGAGVAMVLRIVFTGLIASLMLLPYVKLVGGLALIYIAAKLLVPDDPQDHAAAHHVWQAVYVVAVADIIMSLDNVIAIAAAAEGNMALLVLGLGISIPLIVAGAVLIMALLDRFPVLIWAGAALLGWIAGEVIVTDPAVAGALTAQTGVAVEHRLVSLVSAAGVVLVLLTGGLWRRSKRRRPDEV